MREHLTWELILGLLLVGLLFPRPVQAWFHNTEITECRETFRGVRCETYRELQPLDRTITECRWDSGRVRCESSDWLRPWDRSELECRRDFLGRVRCTLR